MEESYHILNWRVLLELNIFMSLEQIPLPRKKRLCIAIIVDLHICSHPGTSKQAGLERVQAGTSQQAARLALCLSKPPLQKRATEPCLKVCS